MTDEHGILDDARDTVRGARRFVRWALGHNAPQEPWWAEFWSAMATFLWAVWGLINEPPLWSVPAFEMMTLVANSWLWFAIALGLSLWQFLALRHFWMTGRRVACFFLSWLWGSVSLSTMMADFSRPGLAFYIVLMMINLYSVMRLRRDDP